MMECTIIAKNLDYTPATSGNIDYNFPDDGTITTANTTLLGSVLQDFLVCLRVQMPQQLIANHIMLILTNTITFLLKFDMSLSFTDDNGTVVTSFSFPCMVQNLVANFGYQIAQEPDHIMFVFVWLHLQSSFHCLKEKPSIKYFHKVVISIVTTTNLLTPNGKC